ncbi:MAG TPA: hypothetical protein VFX15_13695 [Actinomycetes bacterium]|nr:hypothetical protein [Actinomycetes bacterium]
MKEFAVAAARTEAEGENADEPVGEFTLAGQEFRAYLPSTGQISVLIASQGLGQNLRDIHNLLRKLMLDDGYSRLVGLLNDNVIGIGMLYGGDELNDTGILDYLIELRSGRPTTSSNGSSPSPASGGKRSTGRVRGATSVPSTSLSTAS